MAGAPDLWPATFDLPNFDRDELTDIDADGFVRHEFIHPLLIEAALEQIRAVARGNGLDPAEIRFTGLDGRVEPFLAQMVLRAAPEITRRQMAGKQPGDVIGSETAAREKITATVHESCADPKTREHAIAQLRKRRNEAFAEDGYALLLDDAAARYAVQEPCATCGGGGGAVCTKCRGAGILACRRCHGQRIIACPACNGSHTVVVNGQRQPCAACKVTGRVRCPGCRGSGKTKCQGCRGAGRVGCKPCQGTGWRSIVLSARLRLKGRFLYDDSLPPPLLGLMKELGGALIAEGHAVASVDSAVPADAPARDDELAIAYAGRVPWGTMGVRLGAREAVATLFGYQPVLLDLPAFLEDSAAPGIKN